MPSPHTSRAGLGLLALALTACATAPPAALPEDHPANARAPAAPLEREPSALATYQDFRAARPAPGGDDPAMTQPSGDSAPKQGKEDPHAHHQ